MGPNKKTIFILGAGASRPYGYPIGSELKDRIIDLAGTFDVSLAALFHDLNDGQEQLNQRRPPPSKNPFYNFTDAFRKSGKFTIDEFLRTQKTYRAIGKYAITYALLSSESPDVLYKGNWFQFIWDRLSRNKENVKELFDADIGFVTFNYDLSIEQILYQAIPNTFPESTEEDIKKVFQAIPIVHVHGKIKLLPWEQGYNNDLERIGLQGRPTPEIIGMSKGIRVVHESDIDENLKLAKDLILKSEKIVFLGFGFDPNNFQKLNQLVERQVPGEMQTTVARNPNDFPIKIVKLEKISVFQTKELYATRIEMSDGDILNATNSNNLSNLNFSRNNTIQDFLKENITKFF